MFSIDANNCVRKGDADGALVQCFSSPEEARAYIDNHLMPHDSPVAEFSMSITKASYDKFNSTPRHWRAVDSDIDSDLYDEKMSIELFQDFTDRINNDTPVPEEFKSVICEESWCGGMPYLSIAHYKAGESAKNVPGKVEAIYIDGTRLKSKGVLDDTPLGRQVFDSLCEDAIKRKSGDQEHLPVRISIGFLDLEHKHTASHGGQEFTFTRKALGQKCPLCEQGIGGKIYLKGQLVHLALTRVPVNPRTEMIAEKSMNIVTKKDDARSIVKELSDELDERSLADGTLVVRADSETGTLPVPDMRFEGCYDPNTDTYNQDCVDKVLAANVIPMQDVGTPVKSTAKLLDAVSVSITKLKSQGQTPASEATMAGEKVEKMVLGGESVPEKKFLYEGIDGDPGNNVTANPLPQKAIEVEVEEEEEEDDEKKEMSKKSVVDVAYEQLKSKLEAGASVEEINQAFSQLGTEVEKSYVPKSQPVDQSELVGVIKSLTDTVKSLQIEMAQLKAGAVTQKAQVGIPTPRSLTLKPADLLMKAQTSNQPVRKLSQIERIARASTGAYVPEE